MELIWTNILYHHILFLPFLSQFTWASMSCDKNLQNKIKELKRKTK